MTALVDAATNALYVYHYDGTGHTIAITNASQQTVNTYAYDPYGKLMAQTETIPQPFKYAGQFGVVAEANNLYYMKARYYDANVGRFISEDPIGFEGGLNLYAYVGGSPSGECPWCIVSAVTGGVGAITSVAGYAAGKWISAGEITISGLASTAAIGAVQGALMPYVGFIGNAAIGGTGNIVQDAILSDKPLTAADIGKSFALVAIGSMIGGNFTKQVPYGYAKTAASEDMVDYSNAMKDLSKNTGVVDFSRGFAGSAFSSIGK